MDVVIEEITPDSVTVMRQEKDHAVTETIPISDIAKIKKASVKKMSKTSKVLIGTAVAFGVLVTAALASCEAASSYTQRPGTAGRPIRAGLRRARLARIICRSRRWRDETKVVADSPYHASSKPP